ncbi:MAG: hypothetical protein HQL42_13100 [Alphaproteobacteria bacterium]|nr:hypothetical protein [Alphaproteobacteria bacterium]
MRVQVNPNKLLRDPTFTVLHPVSQRAFPSSGAFELTVQDLATPQVLRLLPPPGQPGGIAGGVFADLVPAAPAAKTPK